MAQLTIGSASEHVMLRLPDRLPLAVGADDDAGFTVDVEIKVEGFAGFINVWFVSDDFRRFLRELNALHVSLEGVARLSPMEEQLAVSISGNGRGLMTVSGSAWSRATYQNELKFSFDVDQTFLVELLATLRAVARDPATTVV